MTDLAYTTINVAASTAVVLAIIVILCSKTTPKPPGPRYG